MSVLGLHHVQVNVPLISEEEAHRFYGELVGMEPISRRTPWPGTVNNGKMKSPGSRRVSRTSWRSGSLARKRRMR